MQCGGNRTECALLLLLRQWGCSYAAVRESHTVVKVFGFSSERKMASVVILLDGKHLLYCKARCAVVVSRSTILKTQGASEVVIGRCTTVLDASGTPQPCTPDVVGALLARVADMAGRGLRTLALAMRRLPEEPPGGVPPEEDMTLIGLLGIQVGGLG